MAFIAILLGSWILFCGVAKLCDLPSFVSIVRDTRLFGDSTSKLIGVGLPPLELVLGLGVLLGLPFFVLMVLMKQTVSLVLLLFLLWKKTPLPNCGCYGNWIKRPLHWTRVIDNVVIIALCLVILLKSHIFIK